MPQRSGQGEMVDRLQCGARKLPYPVEMLEKAVL